MEAQGNELSAREESLKKGGSSLDELRNKVLQPAENQRTTPSEDEGSIQTEELGDGLSRSVSKAGSDALPAAGV